MYSRKRGSTSNIFHVKVADSTSASAAGLTGLTSASAGLKIATQTDNEASATTYTQAGSTIEGITTLGTFAAPTATKIRFKEVDATNQPGVYELQVADARCAVAGSKVLRIFLSGATNMAQEAIVVELTDFDPYVTIQDVRLADGVAHGGATATGQFSSVQLSSLDVSGDVSFNTFHPGDTTLDTLVVSGCLSMDAGDGGIFFESPVAFQASVILEDDFEIEGYTTIRQAEIPSGLIIGNNEGGPSLILEGLRINPIAGVSVEINGSTNLSDLTVYGATFFDSLVTLDQGLAINQGINVSGQINTDNIAIDGSFNVSGGVSVDGIVSLDNASNYIVLGTSAITSGTIDAGARGQIGTSVWSTATRTLTALDEDTTTIDLDGTIRSAIGLASANLDTRLDSIDGDLSDILDAVSGALDVNVASIDGSTVAAETLSLDLATRKRVLVTDDYNEPTATSFDVRVTSGTLWARELQGCRLWSPPTGRWYYALQTQDSEDEPGVVVTIYVSWPDVGDAPAPIDGESMLVQEMTGTAPFNYGLDINGNPTVLSTLGNNYHGGGGGLTLDTLTVNTMDVDNNSIDWNADWSDISNGGATQAAKAALQFFYLDSLVYRSSGQGAEIADQSVFALLASKSGVWNDYNRFHMSHEGIVEHIDAVADPILDDISDVMDQLSVLISQPYEELVTVERPSGSNGSIAGLLQEVAAHLGNSRFEDITNNSARKVLMYPDGTDYTLGYEVTIEDGVPTAIEREIV